MPQPVSYNPGTPVSGSIQENNISYVVDGQNRNYRGGFGGLSWMSEVPPQNNVIFIGNSVSLGRGPANIPLFYPAYNTSQANIVYAANTLPGSPRNFTTSASAYNWAVTNNFVINNSDNPIPRINGDDLRVYIDANQPTSYPQTGVSWYDLSGYSNNGTLINGPVWNSRGSFSFDGTDDYVSITNSNSLYLQDGLSIQFLAKINTIPPPFNGNRMYLVTKGESNQFEWQSSINNFSSNFGKWCFLRYAATSPGGALNGGSFRGRASASDVVANRWTHVVFNLPNSNTFNDVYVNGTLDNGSTLSQNTMNIVQGTANVRIGTRNFGELYLDGEISNVLIYDKALTEAQIKQNYFQSNIVTDGLVFMTDANNLVSYPKSGTSTYSLTGSITGTLLNGVGYSNVNGGTFVLDGADDYITLGNQPTMVTQDITQEAWVNADYFTNWHGIISNMPSWGTGFSLQIGNIQNIAAMISGDYLKTSWLPQTNTWYHIVATHRSSDNLNVLYVNGVQENSVIRSISYVSNAVTDIGCFYTGGGLLFPGKIASVKTYNRALSASEVQQNYQATKDKFQGPNLVTNGLILYLDPANKDSYPGTGNTIYDLSGQGANGTLINGVGYSTEKGGVLIFDGVDDGVDGINLPQNYVDLMIGMYSEGSNGTGLEMVFAKYDDFDKSFRTAGGVFRHSGIDGNDWNYANTQYDYINGSLISTDVNLTNNWNIVRLVNQNSSFAPPFVYSISSDFLNRRYKGKIAFILCYNRVLSTAEVDQNYTFFKTRLGL